MSEPFEILVAPFEVWRAPVGEAFPDVDTTPGGNWFLLGTNGKCNMSEDGVSVNLEQTITEIFTLCGTAPAKAIRPQEATTIVFTLLDATLEHLRFALNYNTITDTPAGSGTPGVRSINIRRGQVVARHALLVRGVSPYDYTLSGQYKVPACYQSGNASLVHNKSVPVGVMLTFKVLEYENAATEQERCGQIEWQDALALP